MSKNKYKKSETIFIKRSEINFAPYNPKRHSPQQIETIKRNIKNVAFLGGIVWNKRTGNLIDGHKRIASLDIIEGYNGSNDYDVKVEMIELDEKTEKEQNIFQTASRTDFEASLLADIISDIDYAKAGLTDEDILQIEVEVPNFEFSRPEIQSELLPISKAALAEERKEKAEERKEKIKAAKSQVKTDNEAANYVTLTFDNFEAKAFFMERFGFGHYDLYIKGERFDEMVERIE